jgi:hypothetical protein
MSKLILTDVKTEDRGNNSKKVIIILEGRVTDEEALRCLAMKKKSIQERTFVIPDAPTSLLPSAKKQ